MDSVKLPDLSLFTIDTLEPLSRPVQVPGPNGTVVEYELREASAHAAMKYKDAAIQQARFDDGKMVGIGGTGGVEAILVSECLFIPNDRQPKNNWRTVGLELVKSWPYRAVNSLFKMVKELSPELEDKDTPESLQREIDVLQKKLAKLQSGKESPAKKEPDATPATSN